jgi:hypothetical protein
MAIKIDRDEFPVLVSINATRTVRKSTCAQRAEWCTRVDSDVRTDWSRDAFQLRAAARPIEGVCNFAPRSVRTFFYRFPLEIFKFVELIFSRSLIGFFFFLFMYIIIVNLLFQRIWIAQYSRLIGTRTNRCDSISETRRFGTIKLCYLCQCETPEVNRLFETMR